MNKKLNKKDLPFFKRHPYIPLMISIFALIFSLTTLVVRLIS